MKYLCIPISIAILLGCNTESPKRNITIQKPIEIDTASTDVAVKETVLVYDVLPFFKEDIEDESFELFYKSLIKACLTKDTTTVLNSIYDTLRFSKYECAYGMYFNAGCEGCTRCTKKGMLEGVFTGSTNTEICDRLYDMITKFGVGKMSNNKLYYSWLKVENAYLNFNFKDWGIGNKYFNYDAIIPLKESVPIKQLPNYDSETIDVLPFRIHEYSCDPGMGQYDEEMKYHWFDIYDGHISSKDVLTGFDFTLVIYEEKASGWKITGFIQPPGC